MEVKLDKFGRIVIPKEIREWLGLEAGMELHLDVTEDENGERVVALRPVHERQMLLEEEGVLVYTGSLQVENFDVVEHLRAAREERSRKVSGF